MEAGKPKISYRMPGGIWPDEARRLIQTAELLGCSVDYLLGREESPAPAPAETVPNLGTWQTGQPVEPGLYTVIADFYGDKEALILTWDGEKWEDGPVDFKLADEKVLCWYKLPNENPVGFLPEDTQ